VAAHDLGGSGLKQTARLKPNIDADGPPPQAPLHKQPAHPRKRGEAESNLARASGRWRAVG
jgi:hypothetical protein